MHATEVRIAVCEDALRGKRKEFDEAKSLAGKLMAEALRAEGELMSASMALTFAEMRLEMARERIKQ